MLFFNFAQTFYLDSSAVKGASEVALTKVDLFFRAKPPKTNNKSGIESPGVEILVVPCLNGIPVINQQGAYRPTEPTEIGAKFAFYSGGQIARVEYDEITPSSSATVPVEFLLPNPVFVKTNQEYAILVKFDGNENFVLWTSKQGDKLVGTDSVSNGPSGRFIGNMYRYIDNFNKTNTGQQNQGYGYTNNAIANTTTDNPALIYTPEKSPIATWDTNYLQNNWRPVPNEDLKFKIYVARYSHSGIPAMSNSSIVANNLNTTSLDRSYITTRPAGVLSNNVIRVSAQCQSAEYIVFDVKNSVRKEIFYGEPVYQDCPQYPGGTTTPLTIDCATLAGANNTSYNSKLVVANGSYTFPNGATFNNSGGFNNIFTEGAFFIIDSSNSTVHIAELRQVEQIISNTELLVDIPFTNAISQAKMKLAATGYINDISKSLVFGKSKDLLTLYNSNANTVARFVSHTITGITINNGGTGYANSDYIKITGFEDIDYSVKGNYAAFANIVTNSSGVITNVHISNAGCGFVNSSWLTGSNVKILISANGVPNTATLSSGTNANLSFSIGSNIRSVFSNTIFANCEIVNLEVNRMKPEITINVPVGTNFVTKHRTLYYKVKDANTVSGKAYYINTPSEQERTDTFAKIFRAHTLNTSGDNRVPVLPSRSNEFNIRFANGEINNPNTAGDNFSNSAVFLFEISSNNDYQAVYFDPEIMNSHYSKYIINREYTNEHTNYGEAWAKHITTKINLAEDRFAEDMLVYLTAYRPANTDFKVFARVHNSADEEAFDDKDWTLLEQIDGIDVYSSQDNSADYIELTYNFRAYPNTEFTLGGFATITQGNGIVSGTGTTFGAQAIVVSAGSGYTNGDIITFTAPTETPPSIGIYALTYSSNAKGTITTNSSGAITSIAISNGGAGWISQANINVFAISNSTGGSTGGSSANVVFIPGLMPNDLIKIYSPYDDFANTTYTFAVVNNVVSNTVLNVKRTYGELSANLVGNVSVTTSTTLTGTETNFTTNFTSGDFIAVWANASVYESRKISSVTNTTQIIVESAFTIANSATKYAKVTPDTFINTSLSVSSLRVDRVAHKNQVYNDIQNDNVATYYSTSMVQYTGYDSMQLKIVMLSENDTIIPKIDDVRGIMVSA